MTGEKKIERHIPRLHALADPQFARELGALLGPPFTEGNAVTAHLNGDEIFPPMLKAIREAQASITFETYIYWSVDIGLRFARALSDAARRPRVDGPVVAQMQAVFLDNWIKVTGRVLPDALTHRDLLDAMARGVKVRIVVPGPHIDGDTARGTSRANRGPLLQAGAVLAEYQPTMLHCEVPIVDGLLTSVGSTNFDNRSFRLNDEATLNVLDAGFARRQREVFEANLLKPKVVSFAEWQQQPWTEKFAERWSRLLALQL